MIRVRVYTSVPELHGVSWPAYPETFEVPDEGGTIGAKGIVIEITPYTRRSNMPVVNTDQARVELSRDQFLGIVEHVHAKFSEREQVPHTIGIEETNLGNTVVVTGSGGTFKMTPFLAFSGGEVRELKETSV